MQEGGVPSLIGRPCSAGMSRDLPLMLDKVQDELRLVATNPTSPTEGVGRRQAAEILGMQLQRSALQGMSAQSTSRLFRVVIFGGG